MGEKIAKEQVSFAGTDAGDGAPNLGHGVEALVESENDAFLSSAGDVLGSVSREPEIFDGCAGILVLEDALGPITEGVHEKAL